ncbi:PAS domain-containing sensor histidine kinase [Methanocella arvoryzae]|uniref:histidine kinase n=1 Tax=Methanocella arvoryzae (strain DSM 22066 / NBRC 105507 / MRE50) TaxID=351160 RepID=Q0W1D6_METAR|nr:PAS domain-containing sensor histidine kinase [Methanocella arvoryzae]CAJ37807.1 putative signal transduction histidine kinase [Methanocella arvoryzae MRE50]
MHDDLSLYQEIYRQSHDGIVIHTGEQIVYTNSSYARIMGADSPACLIGRSIYDFIPAYSRELARQRFKLILEKGINIPLIEDNMIGLDGNPVSLQISACRVGDNSEPLVQVIVRDVTDIKRMEKSLKASIAELDRAQKIARMGSWEWDLRQRRLYWSDETYRILGMEPSEKTPSTEALLKHVHPEDRNRVRKFLSTAKARMTDGKIDFRIVTPDGNLKHIYLEGDVEFDKLGNPIRAFGVFHDITERKMIEAELQNARAQAELYLDLMGHDINNMNQIAMGYLELAIDIVKAGGSITEENLFLIEKPMVTLQSSSRLISNVRKVRNEQAGAYKSQIIDVGKLLREVKAEFSGITGRYVEINIAIRHSPKVRANELLKDVFVNLVGNAIKHSDPGKALTINISAGVALSNGKPYCKVAIEDNGPGIPDDYKRQLFDLQSLDKARTNGKGLGLCLTDMLVRDFGGYLRVENRMTEDYRQGSRFIVILPVAETD